MKVFLSWSGERAKLVAEALAEWLPCVIQALKPFVSTNIPKGQRSLEVIAGELEETRIGIVCVTPEEKRAPWILFEAGALSKTRTATFVCTYLIGMGNADLEPPLGQFQWTRAEKGDTFKLLQTINGALGDSKLTDAQLQLMFEKFWPDLDAKIRALPAPLTPRDETRRKPEDLLPEILETVRAHSATLEGIRSALPSPWEKAIRDAVLAFDDVRVQPQRLPLDWETSYAGKTIGDLMRLTDDELKAIGRRHALKRMAAETKPPAGAEPPPEPPAGLGKKDEPKR